MKGKKGEGGNGGAPRPRWRRREGRRGGVGKGRRRGGGGVQRDPAAKAEDAVALGGKRGPGPWGS